MRKRFYIAYGSNLNINQMAGRCPTAEIIGTGVIQGYELQFKGPPFACATIAPKEGALVPVAVWDIQPADEMSLDRYEGYPTHYFKQDVKVTLSNGEQITGMAYIMDLGMGYGVPGERYFNIIRHGYWDHGLDVRVLEQAAQDSAEKFMEQYRAQREAQFDGEEIPGARNQAPNVPEEWRMGPGQ